ncbi:methionyl-tRNA formyltransferase [Helcococcus ovis]|uniref:Methionyl-tRNA formyltransferase n=1 Tax=Helcococcus ovis TaxID=72026 RepID=A0A4R9C2D5_9FIRM|nr:methionyl-tRNA formyltransferase [Helcococcus ovis]TFF63933.1 methionyl-tRNA formyltransferase [Helcococcus ovis]TFF66778.1 methionyl-tRNA formyltransferase [Helcococcus ovis]TFF67131.1 methionyl-tRNA formyltransferase [Helcococcus ovis]WNZ01930.1 methionyl-tRNA formyltransferase [Helcococcus ovis]
MKKIIFMGTPEFSVNPLISLYNSSEISIELVITGEDKKRSRNKVESTPVKKKAEQLGLRVYTPNNVNSQESLSIIDEINPDFIVVIAYGQLIKKHLLERYKDRIINIHSSLLPKYRGAAPMQWAILNREKQTGVCSMLIEKTMDTGDILDFITVDLDENTDITKLHDNLSLKSGDLIVDTIINYDDKFSHRIQQDNQLASYSQKITKEMGHISFLEDAEDIKAKIMAFSVWPSAYVIYKNEKIKIHKIHIIDKYTDSEEGKIIDVSNSGIFVNCKNKCIVIDEIQFPGKKRMDIKSFLLGNSIEKGEILK